MAGEWFCKIADRERGPLSSAQLKSLAAQGELHPQDLVRQGTDGAWVPADRVKGLFSTVPPKMPQGGVEPRLGPPEPPPIRPVFRGPAQSGPVVFNHDQPTRPAIQVGPAAVAAAKQAAKQRQAVRLQMLGMGALAVLIVVLGVVGYVLWRQGAPSEEPSAAPPVAARPAAPAKKPAPPASKPRGVTPPPPQPEVKWYNGARETAVFPAEQVAIKIRSARVGTLGARFAVRDAAQKYLIVAVHVQNNGKTKKLDFEAWGRLSPSSAGVTLGDEHGNRYKLIRIQGEQSSSIYPGKDYTDEVIFEPPVDTAQTLRLVLPATAFGGKGTVHFEIPRTLITLEPEPAKPAPEKPPAAKPAEKPGEKPAEKPAAPPETPAPPAKPAATMPATTKSDGTSHPLPIDLSQPVEVRLEKKTVTESAKTNNHQAAVKNSSRSTRGK
jgi:hypothetical protein